MFNMTTFNTMCMAKTEAQKDAAFHHASARAQKAHNMVVFCHKEKDQKAVKFWSKEHEKAMMWCNKFSK